MKKPFYKLILTILSFLIPALAAADGGDSLLTRLYEESLMQSIAPVAPTAASLGSYGNHPVELSTGLVPISINLYEVKCGSLSVPIRLNYHGGGIKVEQDATWVGLGWDLDFGGSVVRTMNGFVDELEDYTNVPDATSISTQLANDDFSNYGTFYSLACRTGLHQYSFRPDLFSYNVLGYSGTFFTDGTGEIHPISHEPISGMLTSQPLSSHLHLVTPEGTSCIFNVSEKTRVAGEHGSIDKYPSTYYVSTIVSADGGDSIRYNYQESGSYSILSTNYYEGLYTSPGVDGVQTCPQTIHPECISRNYTHLSLITDTVKPQYIYFRGGRVLFVLTDDLYTTHCTSCKRLERIEIQMRTDSGYDTVKSFLFDYQRDNHDRLYLKSVWEISRAMVGKLVAQFDYYEGLPARNSNSLDYWGFYNGKYNTSKLPRTWLYSTSFVGTANRTPDEEYAKCGSLKRITYPTGGSTEFDWELNKTGAATPLYYDMEQTRVNEEVHPTFNHNQQLPPAPIGDGPYPDYNHYKSVTIVSGIDQMAVLSYKMKKTDTTDLNHRKYDQISLTYGTHTIHLGNNDSIQDETCIQFIAGQSYTVSMEANCSNLEGWFTLSYDSSVSNAGDKPFAGLRIREMVLRDKDSTVLNRREFEYLSPDGKSSGYLTTGSDLSFTRIQITETLPGVTWNANLYERMNMLVCTDMVSGPQENEYGYEYVTEKTIDGRTGQTVSVIRSRFTRHDDEQPAPYVPTVSKAHLRGRLLEREEFEVEGDSLIRIRSSRNTYSGTCGILGKTGFLMHTDYSGLGTEDLVHRTPSQLSLAQIYMPYNYTYTSDWLHLDSTMVSEYGRDGRVLRRETIRHYGNILHAHPTRIVQVQGQDTLEERIQYAPDLQDAASVLMTRRNVMNRPITRKFYRYKNGMQVLQGGINNLYDTCTLLTDVYRIFPDSHQKRLYSYRYDDLLAHHVLREFFAADSIITSVLWNTDQTRPLFIANGMGWQTLHDTVATGALNRTSFPGIEIQSYTYYPDGTISSITDAGGNTTYYGYDSFGRLSSVFDKDGRKTNQIEYNYFTKWP